MALNETNFLWDIDYSKEGKQEYLIGYDPQMGYYMKFKINYQNFDGKRKDAIMDIYFSSSSYNETKCFILNKKKTDNGNWHFYLQKCDNNNVPLAKSETTGTYKIDNVEYKGQTTTYNHNNSRWINGGRPNPDDDNAWFIFTVYFNHDFIKNNSNIYVWFSGKTTYENGKQYDKNPINKTLTIERDSFLKKFNPKYINGEFSLTKEGQYLFKCDLNDNAEKLCTEYSSLNEEKKIRKDGKLSIYYSADAKKQNLNFKTYRSHSGSGIEYTIATFNKTLEGVPQAENLQAKYHRGKFTISWRNTECYNNSDYNYDGHYVVQYSAEGNDWKTIDHKNSDDLKVKYGKNYSIDFDLPEDEINKGKVTYSFRVYRSLFNEGVLATKTSIDANTDYAKITNLNFDKNKKAFYLKLEDNAYANKDILKYTLKISKDNVTFEDDSNIKLAESSSSYDYVISPKMTDCERMYFEIYASHGSSPAKLVYSFNDVIMPNNGSSISSFNASKGFYNDRIELDWTIDKDSSDFTEFNIEKFTLKGEDEIKRITAFEPVIKAENSKLSYKYTDTEIEAGDYYLYKVNGIFSCDKKTPIKRTKVAVGNASAYGSIEGKVTYNQGIAVNNCDLLFEPDPDAGVLPNMGIVLSPSKDEGWIQIDSLSRKYSKYNDEDNAIKDFTVQFWCKINADTLEKQQILAIKGYNSTSSTGYDNLPIILHHTKDKQLLLSVGKNITVLNNTKIEKDIFTHISISSSKSGNNLIVYINGEATDTVSADLSNNNFDVLFIGSDKPSEKLKASIDELRIWSSQLSPEKIKDNYDRIIYPEHIDLKGYYRFDEPNLTGNNLITQCYDISTTSYSTKSFNENHGALRGEYTRSSDPIDVPDPRKLSYKATTDESGNYKADNILPINKRGVTYTITPVLGTHEFNPSDKKQTLNTRNSSFSNINFEDISSFTYNGKVVYAGGNYPVEGCSFYVDGVQQMNSDNEIITSDSDGKFSLSIPIGEHTIKISKNGHGFLKDTIRKVFLDEELSYNVRFYDTTRVRVIGRVVGGKVESEKALGFSESNNNVGTAIINLKAARDNYELDTAGTTKTVNHFNAEKANDFTVKGANISIKTNKETGEFYADLYPEKYTITAIKLGETDILDGVSQNWDLSNAPITDIYKTRVRKDTVYPNPDFADKYIINETTDSIAYRDTFCYVYRVPATLDVTELNGNKAKEINGVNYLGETFAMYSTELSPKADTVSFLTKSADSISYEFGYPVYFQNNQYNFLVKLFEEYTNWETKEVDRVAVTDEDIRITDEMSKNSSSQDFTTDENGEYIYSTQVYAPNTTNGLLKLEIAYPCLLSKCPEPFVMNSIVLGSKSTGTNFMTQGPDQVFFVLRDPPGSNSYAYREEMTSTAIKTTYSIEQGFDFDIKTMVQMGTSQHVITLAGGVFASVGTQQDFDFTNDLGVGIAAVERYNESGEKVTTITNTQRIETSAEPDFVGSDADVYVGASTNILYGYSNFVNVQDSTAAKAMEESLFYNKDKSFVIGKNKGISLGQRFNTTFHYTQRMIEEILIPEWKTMIKSLLIFEDVEKVQNADITSPKYCSNLDADDELFGTLNTNRRSSGNSYTIVYPKDWDDNKKMTYTDSVAFFNQQIAMWENIIRLNEQAKVRAKDSDRERLNFSFGDGVAIDYSISKDTASFKESSVGGGFVQSSEGNCGFMINNTGVQLSVNQSLDFLKMDGSGSESTKSLTYGFVLSDQDGNNKLSIDIVEAKGIGKGSYSDSIPGGFIFMTKGGQTSCPFEAGDSTKYFKPGTPLNAKTMQMEVPVLKVTSNNYVSGVPADGQAVYEIELLNDSEVSEDNWFTLSVNSATNPNGAIIRLDGKVITEEGTDVFVPYGSKGVKKTLTIERGPRKYDYKDIELVLSSRCQYSHSDDDIKSTATVSATFLQGCSEVEVVSPLNQWTMNTETGSTLNIKVAGFDKNFENLGYIDVQYKESYSSSWNSLHKYFFNEGAYKQASDKEKSLSKEESELNFSWDMKSIADGSYDIRAVSVCIDPVTYTDMIRTTSTTLSGVKDMVRPQMFGRPEPRDGVLDIDDEIIIKFNEPIACGRIIDDNIQVTGVKNNATGSHNTSVHFDGTGSISTATAALKAPFTIEMWARKNDGKAATLFSHAGDSLQIGFGADSTVFITSAGADTIKTFVETNDWMHIAVTQDSNGYVYGRVSYGEFTDEFEGKLPVYNKYGKFVIGNNSKNTNGVAADMHQLRIWNECRSVADISKNINTIFAASTKNLSHYYLMEEGIGNMVEDKTGALNGQLNGQWALKQGGRCLAADGKNAALLPIDNIGFGKDDDYSIEFWFQGNAQNATIASVGAGNGDDSNESVNKLSVAMNEDGSLSLSSNGKTHNIEGKYDDNAWHHFALSVNRLANANVYVDAELKSIIPAEQVGGITGDSLAMGARRYYKYNDQGGVDLAVDQHFTGLIDEVRIWNAALDSKFIEEQRNVKRKANEIGLVACYSFDEYTNVDGTEEITFSTANLAGENNASIAKAMESSEYAPIKDAGPVENLAYNYVCNGDQLLISLNERRANIEKTTVTIRVDKIKDLNGNNIKSAAIWSAYIDQAQLKWENNTLVMEEEAGNEVTSKLKIVNTGAKAENFSIDNVPAWISIEPTTGTVEPQATAEITFKADKRVSAGKYSQAILLNSTSVDQLNLSLNLKNAQPEWRVNPGEYQYSMSVVSSIAIDGVHSTDTDDMIAVFVGNECRGVANLTYEKAYGLYISYLTIYSNTTEKEELSFRIWDASAGEVRVAKTEKDIEFKDGYSVGTTSDPILFRATTDKQNNFNLVKGWNWISFNTVGDAMKSINSPLVAVSATKEDQIKNNATSEFASYSAANKKWVGTLTGLSNKTMYHFKSSGDKEFAILANTAKAEDVELSIGKGINFISYIPTKPLSVSEALASYKAEEGDLIKSQSAFAIFEKGKWMGNLEVMEPGKGYILNRKGEGTTTFHYPNASLRASFAMPQEEVEYSELDIHAYPNNMSMVAKMNKNNVAQSGDWVVAYAGDEVRGACLVEDADDVIYLPVYGNESNDSITFSLVRNGQEIGKFAETTIYKNNDLQGKNAQPFGLTISAENALKQCSVSVYPTLVQTNVNVMIKNANATSATITVTNAAGRTISNASINIANGAGEYIWNATNAAQGQYFITVSAGDDVKTTKIEKQ